MFSQSDVLKKDREVSQLEMETWCNENSIACCVETSAKNASNVQEAFHMAVQHWLRMEKTAEKESCICDDTVDLRRTKPAETRTSCCLGTSEE